MQTLRTWARHLPMARWLKKVLVGPHREVAPPPPPIVRPTAVGTPTYQTHAGFSYKNYWPQVDENYRSLSNPFEYHELLIEQLESLPDVTFVPLFELEAANDPSRRIVGLRYDIDADPVTGLRAARSLARRGICGSFYLLHTAPYYGHMIGDRFVRHAQMEEWLLDFIVTGCELGLHNDAFGVCQMFGRDGAQAVHDEIQWLRQYGATIRGTVAHNSGPVHKAENYEVFVERLHWERAVQTSAGLSLPLGVLSEVGLGLTYEGTFSRTKPQIDLSRTDAFLNNKENTGVRSDAWMKTFLLDNPYREFTLDFQYWLVGRDEWVFSGQYEGKEYFRSLINLNEVFETLQAIPSGTKTLFVLHPEYFKN